MSDKIIRISNNPGMCAACGSELLEYGKPKLDGTHMIYPYTCETCAAVGEELYELSLVENRAEREVEDNER